MHTRVDALSCGDAVWGVSVGNSTLFCVAKVSGMCGGVGAVVHVYEEVCCGRRAAVGLPLTTRSSRLAGPPLCLSGHRALRVSTISCLLVKGLPFPGEPL